LIVEAGYCALCAEAMLCFRSGSGSGYTGRHARPGGIDALDACRSGQVRISPGVRPMHAGAALVALATTVMLASWSGGLLTHFTGLWIFIVLYCLAIFDAGESVTRTCDRLRRAAQARDS